MLSFHQSSERYRPPEGKNISARAADERVTASAADEQIVAGTAVEDVAAAVIAEQHVVAVAAVQGAGAASVRNDVVPGRAIENIITSGVEGVRPAVDRIAEIGRPAQEGDLRDGAGAAERGVGVAVVIKNGYGLIVDVNPEIVIPSIGIEVVPREIERRQRRAEGADDDPVGCPAAVVDVCRVNEFETCSLLILKITESQCLQESNYLNLKR